MQRSLVLCLSIVAILTFAVTADCQTLRHDNIPSSTMAAVFLKPKDAFAQSSLELFPREIASAYGRQYLGLDPMEIKAVTLLIDRFENLEQPPGFAIIVEFDSPVTLSEQILGSMEVTEINGQRGWRIPNDPTSPVLTQPNERRLVFGMASFVEKMRNASGADSKLISLV